MNDRDVVIKAENISKRYRIGLKEKMHDSIGAAMIDFVKSPWKNYKKYRSLYRFDENAPPPQDLQNGMDPESDIIWALRDVSFEVQRGDVVGIVGRNGSGKSTLLKILSRITDPTYGRAEFRGKLTSLLEVGTGFHPELSGRENVYLNGSILGMTKKEVDRKFDAIVEFSDIGKFIDTPVKRYSSGMRVRLAFSVAAHLEPDILLVDEVLAVGDAQFQKKCLGRMKQIGEGGRTVLFVSHNMAAVSALCTSCIHLQAGQLVNNGPTQSVVQKYMQSLQELSEVPIADREDRRGDGSVKLQDVWVEDELGQRVDTVSCSDKMSFHLTYKAQQPERDLKFRFSILNDLEERVLSFDTRYAQFTVDHATANGQIRCDVDRPIALMPGRYYLSAVIWSNNKLADNIQMAINFDVLEADFYKTGKLPSQDSWPMVLMDHRWSHTNSGGQ
jgi:lipopolysaccharide transport system ATP-binding protein